MKVLQQALFEKGVTSVKYTTRKYPCVTGTATEWTFLTFSRKFTILCKLKYTHNSYQSP